MVGTDGFCTPTANPGWRCGSVSEDSERLLTINELSTMLGIPVDTLYGWRHRGEGPQGYRIGRHVRYKRAVVETWLASRLDVRGG